MTFNAFDFWTQFHHHRRAYEMYNWSVQVTPFWKWQKRAQYRARADKHLRAMRTMLASDIYERTQNMEQSDREFFGRLQAEIYKEA